MVRTSFTPALLAGLATVATAGSPPPDDFRALTETRHCQNLTIPISISARNGIFNLKAPSSDIEVTNFILNLAQPGKNYTADLLEGYKTVSGNYTIAATHCTPPSSPAPPNRVLQILTHGIGFDRAYWDLPHDAHNNSYVNAALARGYATFAFDRLGVGASSRGDPVSEVQAPLEIAALKGLTAMLRAAALPGLVDDAVYDRVVHVGHSFGAIQTYGLVAGDPWASDGVALQGFAQAPAPGHAAAFLLGGNFARAGNSSGGRSYPDGYLAPADASAVQTNFFSPGMFDPAVLEAAYETGQPVTVGELLTLGGPTEANSSFAGPVLVVTGERDIPFCGGNCTTSEPSVLARSKQFFADANDFETVVVPGAGHGLNLEYSWPTTYASILDFFDKNVKGQV